MKSSRQKIVTAMKNKRCVHEADNVIIDNNLGDHEQLSGNEINETDDEDILPQIIVSFHNE